MLEIKLTQNKIAMVDGEDFETLNKYKWYAKKFKNTFYAARNIRLENGKQKTILMHSIIMQTPVGMMVDHRNGDGLNNQRNNIRIVTRRQNAQNRHDNSSSKYPGVNWNNEKNKWQSSITINNKCKFLKRCDNELDAYVAYLKALKNINEICIYEGAI